jgi:hypothetical protein
LVQDQHGNGANADGLAGGGEMHVHGFDTNFRHDDRRASLALRADGTEQIR